MSEESQVVETSGNSDGAGRAFFGVHVATEVGDPAYGERDGEWFARGLGPTKHVERLNFVRLKFDGCRGFGLGPGEVLETLDPNRD